MLTTQRMNASLRRMILVGSCGLLLCHCPLLAQTRNAFERTNSAFAPIDLRDSLQPSALKDIQNGPVVISGRTRDQSLRSVLLRVTTSRGLSYSRRIGVSTGKFLAAYPDDFPNAPKLMPGILFVDATVDSNFQQPPIAGSSETTIIVYDGKTRRLPDFPSAFTTDLLDAQGRSDQRSETWPVIRNLVNLYMHSYGAHLAGAGNPDFDLAVPKDFDLFKNSIALYDFQGRDKNWSGTKKPRVARTFWKSVWNTWFNSSNDHPLDGNPTNQSPLNYLPYAFTNDFADILIEHLTRYRLTDRAEGNLEVMCREGLENLIACQHRQSSNFALPDVSGHRETYTAGAFRYGMFVNGDFMTEGKGWFYNPAFRDYAAGGVLNGRAIWALGEGLRAFPTGAFASKIKVALSLGVQFCLQDAQATGYAHRTAQGNRYWRDAGEHAYLALGLVNACTASRDLIALKPDKSLRSVCVESLNALVDLQQPSGQWAIYPNVDSMVIAALAEGALALPNQPEAKRWRQAAERSAKGWLAAKVDLKEFLGPTVHFGLRLTSDSMSYRWSRLDPKVWGNRNFIFFYQSGHWIQALSGLAELTGDDRYRKRAEAMVSYLCGDNPWGVRLLNEIGGVYNWVEDRDGDGIEDQLKQDMYPESTAFCKIGLFHLLQAKTL